MVYDVAPPNRRGAYQRAGRSLSTDREPADLLVDDIIDPNYFEQLFPGVAEAHLDYRMFFTRIDQHHSAPAESLARRRVKSIQPGIESLASCASAMRKGVGPLRLTCAGAAFIALMPWNLLFGFPTSREIAEYRKLIPTGPSTRPMGPDGFGWSLRPLFEDRFSFPLKWMAPRRRWVLYPPDVDLNRIAYVFDYELEDTLRPAPSSRSSMVDIWKVAAKEAPDDHPAPCRTSFRSSTMSILPPPPCTPSRAASLRIRAGQTRLGPHYRRSHHVEDKVDQIREARDQFVTEAS